MSNNYWLKKWELAATDECTFCKTSSETILHLFWECDFTQRFWRDFNYQYSPRIDSEVTLNTMVCGSQVPLFCTLVFRAKRYIYECKYTGTTPCIREYNYKVEFIKNTECEIAKRNGNVTKYLEKWEQIL